MREATREFWRGLVASPVATWFAIATSFFLFGLFGVSLLVSQLSFGLLERLREAARIEAFLSPDADPDLARGLAEELAGVGAVAYVSGEDALRELWREFPELRGVEAPLGGSLRITPTPSWRRAELLGLLAEKVSLLPGVEEVYWGEEFLRKAENFYKAGVFATAALFLLAFFGATFVIFHSVRLVVERRKEVVELALLLGASPARAKLPFALDGAFFGLVGGGLASGLVWGAARLLALLVGVEPVGLSWTLSALPAAGALLGLLGAWSALGEVK